MRISVSLLAVLLALMLGGCGSSDSSSSTSSDEPAATESDSAGPNANTGGTIGDDFFLQDADGNQFDVAVTKYISKVEPGSTGFPADSGNKWVGVQVEYSGGDVALSDQPVFSGKLIDTDGNQYESNGNPGGECPSPDTVRISPGDSRKVCIPFQIPKDATGEKFQYTLDSGTADSYGEWTLDQR